MLRKSLFGLLTILLIVNGAALAGMMNQNGMQCGKMRGGMRPMMKRMMSDILPAVNPALLPDANSKGAHLLDRYCTQCHNLPGPGLHTAAQWPAVVKRMNRRMQMMTGMMGIKAPNRQELATILTYLQAHGQEPVTAALTPYLNTKAGRAFRGVCSRCHVLPSPTEHTAAEWPALVARMKGYMASMGKPVPNEKTMKEIVGFLRKHAGSGK